MKKKPLVAVVALVLLGASCGPSAALSAPTGATVAPTAVAETALAESAVAPEQRDDLFDNPTDPKPDGDATFEPISVAEYGIEAVVPAGWIKVLDEYYIAPDQSVELLIRENQTEALEDFLAFWGASGAIAEKEVNGLVWTMRQLWRRQDNVAGYVATCPSENGFYMVLLVTARRERQTGLYDAVLLPIVEAFTIGLPGD